MATLYSAAVTIDGEKKRAVEFELTYTEKYALKLLVASVIAVRGLTPTADTIICGTRLPAEWCHSVAEGMEDLIGLKEEDTLIVEDEHLKDLRLIRKQLNAMFKDTTDKDKSLNIDGTDIGHLVAASNILAAYKDDQIGLIIIGGSSNSYEITRARIGDRHFGLSRALCLRNPAERRSLYR